MTTCEWLHVRRCSPTAGSMTRPTEGFKMLQALFNLILSGFGATGSAVIDVVNWED